MTCACSGYCLHITDEILEFFGVSIKTIVDASDEDEKRFDDCKTVMDAIHRQLNRFGDGREIPLTVNGKTITAALYSYDPDNGGEDDNMEAGPYFEFSESDLFVMTPTPISTEIPFEIPFCRWVIE